MSFYNTQYNEQLYFQPPKLGSEQQKLVYQQMKLIKYKIMTNSLASIRTQRILPQSYQVGVISPFTKDKLVKPVRNLDCYFNSQCVWQFQDIIEVVQKDIRHGKSKNIKNIQSYQCPVCKQWSSQIKTIKKISSLYFDKDLQLALRIAQTKFYAIKNEKSKANQKVFKAGKLTFHKNGKVQFNYIDIKQSEQQAQDGKKIIIKKKIPMSFVVLHPSLCLKDQNIYYNPSDYKYNKDGIKIAHRVLQKLILNKFKAAIESMETYKGSDDLIKHKIKEFEITLSKIYKQNITKNQNEPTQIAIKFIKYYCDKTSIEILVFYPRHKAWNTFCIEKQNGKFDDMNVYTQALVDGEKVYLISQKWVWEIDLTNTYKKRFKRIEEQTTEKQVHELVKQSEQQEKKPFVDKKYPLRPMIYPKEIQQENICARKVSTIPVPKNFQIIKYRFIFPSLIIVKQCIYWFGGKFDQGKNQFINSGMSFKMKLDRPKQKQNTQKQIEIKSIDKFDQGKNQFINSGMMKLDSPQQKQNTQKWIEIKSIPPQYLAFEPSIVHPQQSNFIYLIGGQRENGELSNDIIQYDIQKDQYKIYKNHIKVKNYFFKCIVTKSVNPNILLLMDIKQPSSNLSSNHITGDGNHYIKVFDKIKKEVNYEFMVDDFYKKYVDSRNQPLQYYAYPAIPAYYQGVNYFITGNKNFKKDNQLVYGTDDSWFISQTNQCLR